MVHRAWAHDAVGLKAQHNKPFADAVKALGLEGKPTATTAGEAFKTRVAPILRDLGPFPGARLNFSEGREGPQDPKGPDSPDEPEDPQTSGPKKQTTRMLKASCSCGRVLRVTRKVAEQGPVICGCCLVEFSLSE